MFLNVFKKRSFKCTQKGNIAVSLFETVLESGMFLLVFVAAVHAFSSGEQQLLSSCSVCASDYGGLSCCGAWTLGYLGSVVVEHGL